MFGCSNKCISPPQLSDRSTATRRTLHQCPEIAYEEHETARYCAERLKDLGIEVQTGWFRLGCFSLLVDRPAKFKIRSLKTSREVKHCPIGHARRCRQNWRCGAFGGNITGAMRCPASRHGCPSCVGSDWTGLQVKECGHDARVWPCM